MKRTVTALALAIFVTAVVLTFVPRAIDAGEPEVNQIDAAYTAYRDAEDAGDIDGLFEAIDEAAAIIAATPQDTKCHLYAEVVHSWMWAHLIYNADGNDIFRGFSEEMANHIPVFRNDCLLSL